MAGPQDTTGRLRQVTRRQFTAAVGLGLTAAGASFAVADCASGTSTTPARPAVATRSAPSATPPPAPPEGPLLDPFTGEPVKALGPVLAVKIDNIVYARPQTGLQSADIIYVIPVEGGLTRFMAVYSSHFPPVVGRCAAPAKSIGSGKAVVLRDGCAYTVRWSRPNNGTATTYTLPDGQRMLFAPGQTWVALAPDSHASYLNAAKV